VKRREEVERREGRKGKEVNWEGKEGMGRNYRTGEGRGVQEQICWKF